MKPWFLGFILLVFAGVLTAEEGTKTKTITIIFNNVQEAKGKIQYSVVSEKDQEIFPHPGKKENGSFGGKIDVPNKGKVTVKVTLKTGSKYAISSYHDVNGDGKFNLLMYCIPQEPYGFSKLKTPPLGEPSFDECAFDPNKTSSVSVGLK